jgi:hypothetical protein
MPSSIAHTLIGRTPFASYEFSRQAAEIVLAFGVRLFFSPPFRYPRKRHKSPNSSVKHTTTPTAPAMGR